MVLIMEKKSLKISIIALVFTGAFSGQALAQANRLQYADKQYELANYRIAAEEYSEIYAVRPGYLTAKKAAQSLDAIYAYSESYEWWKKTIAYSEAVRADFASLIRAGYRSVENYDPSGDLRSTTYELGDFEEFSNPDILPSVAYRVYELKGIDELNSNASDYGLTREQSGIQFFASNRGDGGQRKKSGIRFDAKGSKFSRNYFKSDGRNYYGIYSKSESGEVKKVAVEGFELYHLSDPQPLSNGKLIFSATPNMLKSRDAVIYPGIFVGTWDPETQSVKEVTAFPYNQTNGYSVMSPRVDEEKKRIYFSSNRPGGQGGYDLYYSSWDDEMNFSEPVNLGKAINSASNERDGLRIGTTFYFASDRNGGFGGLDVYQSTRSGDSFGPVSNLGQPINSVADDFGFVIAGKRGAYLASDRVGGQGFDDLYSVNWSDRNLKIFVVDQAGNSLREGTSLLLADASSVTDVTSTSEEGLLNLTKKGSSYTFTAARQGYFTQKLSVTLNKDQEEVTLVMTPIPYGLEVYQAIIYYDLDKDFLRELSKEKLDEIRAYMSKHPELNLVIESHTDSRATDRYNQKLSERRARSVTRYLEERGIIGDRVSAAWFSETRLVNDCGDGIPCPEPAHQLNRRVELKLVAFTEPNRQYDWPIGAKDLMTEEDYRNFFITKE